MPSPSLFTYTVIVSQCAIEQYGHVNNAIYVQWIQDAAARQPESIPRFDQPENKGWIAPPRFIVTMLRRVVFSPLHIFQPKFRIVCFDCPLCIVD